VTGVQTCALPIYLILEGFAAFSDMRFENGCLIDFGVKREVILEAVEKGLAFRTSGCPDCNRPMANETFSKIYNFPKKPHDEEIESIRKDLGL
jgi:biotin synthase